MAMSDPFETTYNGTMQAKESLGQGIQQAAGSAADAMKQKQQLAQQAKQRQQGFQTLQSLGLVKQNDPTNDDLAKGLTDAGTKMGVSVNVNHGDSPDQERKNMMGIYKAMGIPIPKGSIDVMPGTTIDAGGGMSYTAPKPISQEAQSMRELTMEQKKESMDNQEEKKDFELSDKINKETNPTVAPTRSVLGVIGQTTVRAKRAIDQLTNPNIPITPQLLAGIGSDIAGILQGGAPTQSGMTEQQYETLQSTVAKATQYLTANPQNALPPQLNKQLVASLKQLNDSGKKYIKDNMQSTLAVHKDWIKKNPDKWQELKDSINQDYGLDEDQGGSNGAKSVLAAAGLGNSQPSNQVGKYSLVQ